MTMTASGRLITMTDHRGEIIVPVMDLREPEKGSVVLTDGRWGTAYQRHFADGLWYATTGAPGQTWEWLLTRRNLVLVYDAEVRPDGAAQTGGRR
jgi:hypothetical protein